jgi:hypothetical protein
MPPQTQLGTKVAEMSASAKDDLKGDLDKLAQVPVDVLRTMAYKIAKTLPACNVIELAAVFAEQHSVSDPQALSDAASVFSYILTNIEDDSPQTLIADLVSLGLLSGKTARILGELLGTAAPLRETANVVSSYLRIGAPLFVGMRGTVDLRLRFHKTDEELGASATPTKLYEAHPVVLVNLTTTDATNEEHAVCFLMDENDLSYMKRFVKNMERELELSKTLLMPSEQQSNG